MFAPALPPPTCNNLRRMLSDKDRAAEALRKARSILAITGAGISAESGIPTFRGEGGLWQSYNPEQLATWPAFENDPKKVWQWYDGRRIRIANAQPNRAHHALARMEAEGKRVVIVTQNVDDLHERAGSGQVIHLHGSIWQATCLAEQITYELRETPLAEIPPRCPCGGRLRPNVVFFDEEVPAHVVAAIETYFARQKPDVALVIGTRATFDYVLGYALRAKKRGALLVEINPETTPLTPFADLAIHEKAGEVLGRLTSEIPS